MENFTNEEKDYYELLVDMLDDGVIDESERNILNKRKEKYGISDEKAKKLEEFAKSNNSDASNDLLEKGKTYYFNREYYKAIEILKKAVDLNPNDNKSWRWLISSYSKNGQYEEALKCRLKVTELNPNYYECWLDLGNYYYENGQYEKAINSLLKAVELNPDDSNNWHWLGRSYNFNKQYQEAINSLLRAVKLGYNNEYNWFLLADAYLNLEDYYNAIDCYERAININNSVAVYWNDYGFSLEKVNRLEEAKNAYKRAYELDPNEKLL